MLTPMIDLNLIQLLNRAIVYFESNLTQPALVEEAAMLVGYSRYHFSRLFLMTTGLTPAAYLRKRRLSAAAYDLAYSSKRILDIALDYQFQSHEAFSRSFKQEFGLSPARYRLQGRGRRLLDKITLGATRLLYPGKGIEARPHLLRVQQPLVAALLVPDPNETGEGPNRFALVAVTSEPPKVRRAHGQDIPALCRLYHCLHEFTVQGVPDRLHSLGDWECFDAAQLAHSLAKLLDVIDVTIWVAEVKGQVVGLAEVYLRQDEANPARVAHHYGYLQSLVVDPRWRGQGIGRQLLAAAEAWCKEQGASELRLDTWEFDQGPLGFYSQQGYRTLRRTLVRAL